jgi:tetratricopeptide (TPR) repeat protein
LTSVVQCPSRAAQCKCYEPWKTLPPPEIEEEVRKARTFPERIGLYAILTTAKVSGQAQLTVRRLNREHAQAGLFQIELLTWDQIKDLLHQHPQVANEFYGVGENEQLKVMQQDVSAIRVTVEAVRDEKSGEVFHAEIDSARQFIEQHEYQVGRLILQQLKTRQWDKLDSRQRFRVLANLGAAHLGEGQLEEAAKYFWEAKPHQPDDEKACANEALGFQLTRNPDKAFELAEKYRAKFPNSARILAIWVRNSPATKRLDELAKDIPDSCLVDAELCASLAAKAASENQFEKAEAFARKAIALNAEWSFPRLLLAKMIMRLHLEKVREHSGESFVSSERVREAENLCSEAIALAQKERDTRTEAEALSARALIHEQAGRKKEAKEDALRAHHLDPSDPTIIREYALVIQERGEIDEAVELMRKVVAADQVDPMSWYVLALTLRKRGGPGDAEEAAKIFGEIAQRTEPFPPGFREHVAEGAVAHYCALQRWEEAQAVVDGIPAGTVSTVVRATLKAVIHWRKKDQQEAFKWADAALAAQDSETPRNERRILARLLSECGRYAGALDLWRTLTNLDQFDGDTHNYLECARKLGRANLIAEGCRKLRQSGVDDEQVVDLELSVLEKFDVEEAIKLLQEYLANHPGAKVMRLRLSLVGLRLNRNELVCVDPTLLPSLEEVDPTTGHAVVQVLKFGGRPNEAMEFAYRLLRKHFSEISAHRAFCLCLHPFGPTPSIETSEIVRQGFAVCYQEKGEATTNWVVFEDLPTPEASRNEIAPDSHLARRLEGKRVGEEVIIAEGSVSNRAVTIKEVVSKYVFRYQDCMRQWQLRFPDTPEIEVVKVKHDPDSEALDLSAVFASVDRRVESVAKIKEIYRSNPVTIHLLAERFGGNSFDATIALATSADAKLNCCTGTSEEESAALEAMAISSTVVIDLTALATLALLDGLTFLGTWSKEFVISQATAAELHKLVQTERQKLGHQSGVLTKVAGQYGILEDSSENQAARIERLEQYIADVLRHCKVSGCMALASLDPEKRRTLVVGCGQHGAESMVLASSPGTILWTDDHTLARVAKGEFGVRRVWTQIVLQSLTLNGLIAAKDFYEASAKLLGWGYAFTSPSAPALEQAGISAKWNPGEWPLKQSLEVLAEESLSLIDSLRLAAAFLVAVYSGKYLPDTEKVVVAATLERLAKRKGGITGIGALAKALPNLFSLNVVGCQRAQGDIQAWLKHAAGEHPEIL